MQTLTCNIVVTLHTFQFACTKKGKVFNIGSQENESRKTDTVDITSRLHVILCRRFLLEVHIHAFENMLLYKAAYFAFKLSYQTYGLVLLMPCSII